MGTMLPSNGHFQRELDIQKTIEDYCAKATANETPTQLTEHITPIVRHLNNVVLNSFLERIVALVSKIPLFTPAFRGKLVNLLHTNTEAKKLLNLHKKIVVLFKEGRDIHLEKNEKPTLSLLALKVKSIKYEYAIGRLMNMPEMASLSKQGQIEETYELLPKKVKKSLEAILHFSGVDFKSKTHDQLLKLLPEIAKVTDASGKNAFQQIAELLVEKKAYSEDLIILDACMRNPLLLQDAVYINCIRSDDVKAKISEIEPTSQAVGELARYVETQIEEVNGVFRKLVDKIDVNLSIYEASAERLAEKFGDEVLSKPISVTMCGVEYQGFIKEGGLAEALEGMAQGLLKQHPENKVRLIFPKFSVLPKPILDQLKNAPRTEYKDSQGNAYAALQLTVNGVECFFIEHPHFEITSKERSIYLGNEQEMKERFVTFSSLAADLMCELPKTDIIHLHDWHVAGVELKLRNQNKEVAPIVFSYHNNQRGAQGRYFHEQYNYEPVIEGLKQAGIASQNINLMVDAVKKADCVTTVSSSFAVESQSVAMGEGISFAMREAAKEGKLQGIVNGTNIDRWDPKTDPALKNWKDLSTGKPLDLTYGIGSDDILEKKELSKQQLQLWVKENFPGIEFDCNKPIVTFIGRYDYYQKGLDTFEAAAEAALKNGAQIIFMGTGSMQEEGKEVNPSKVLLDGLQKKYKSGVLVLQDYKNQEGKLNYQQGSSTKQGIGSVVRAATDVVFLPSRFEPCGLVQFEAWLFGSLVVASSVGGFRDTVNPPGSPNFNGYLFDRGVSSNETTSLGSVMKQSLDAFRSEGKDTRIARMNNTMSQGKKNGWNTAPSGYSPVEKYRFVYENAKEKAKARLEAANATTFDLQDFRRILHVFSKKEISEIPLEETYLQAFYTGISSRIKSLYKQLPDWLKRQMPTPYALDVKHLEFDRLGAKYSEAETRFAVDAPSAKQVSVMLFDDKGWQKQVPMQRGSDGTWSVAIPNLPSKTEYQYSIDGKVKIDPYGLSSTPIDKAGQVPRSKVVDRSFTWDDTQWMQKRAKLGSKQPMTMYEMHPASWQTEDGKYLNYREIAQKLVEHCKTTGCTHVELMGILEHPNEGSQGYQVTNYFSPNSRMGSVEDFKFMVDYLHKNDIGVVLDWVPNHFALDDYALTKFDGTNQFEPSKIAALFSLRGLFMLQWGANPFNLRKKATRNFLISSAAYWLKEMHIDGLRVDAIRPLLNSEHPSSSRKFLRELNDTIHKEFRGAITIAEDYSGSLQATKATSLGGYGFDLKWNVGWAKNIMDYMKVAPKERPMYYNRLIQAIEGDTFHKMVMAISHDEIGKTPLIDMTPGLTEKQKCANMRALFSLQMCLPGKKLFFMGSELGSSMPWLQMLGQHKGLLDNETSTDREKIQTTIQALSELYKNNPALFQKDDNAHNLEWIEKKDQESSFIAYRRVLDDKRAFACYHNFSVTEPKKYELVVPKEHVGISQLAEVFTSNALEFGGDGNYSNAKIETQVDNDGRVTKYTIWVPPLSAVVIEEKK